jgi:glutaryl-CoA dehydrogenase
LNTRTSNLDPLDLYDVRSELSDDERMVQETVARFVDDAVIPLMREAFEQHKFPMGLVPQVAELGLFGSSIDGYDCAGLNSVSYGLICQELERGDSGLRSFVSVQSSLVMFPIHAYGSDEQKDRWLPAMARGEAIGCFGLTEPQGGSDPGNMKTHAKRDGDDWVINGAKMWITNGSIADVAVVWALTEEGVKGFLVEKDTPGFTTQEIENKFSLRASVTSALFFDNVRVPEANVLPGVTGLKGPLSCLTQARYGISWGVIGAAMAVFDEVRQYGLSRIQFGKPIASFQLYQAKLVEMLNEITKGQLMNLQLGRLKQAGKVTPQQVSLAKRNCCYQALEVARAGRDMLGANGVANEYQTMRHMCNLESVKTYEGTHDIHTLILGRHVTGLDAFA